ncbi:MAG: flavodoxin [Mesorhizobium sp.]|uniref:flavodoxin n=1 Tax=Mesorhizobium sp. TaxID=1871066 RepID=UPI0012135B4C|nr:flavodoxin [Mesorhizobium sp.]TIM26162.1 MAG: flavodoxin [Mesorhizobium sp.]
MISTTTISRRQALQRTLLLPLVAGVSSAASAEPAATGRSATVLVAYFTRTGNTRLIATQIARALEATLFQIVPAAVYPEDYETQVAQAEDERQRGFEPPLQATVPDLSSYETVFLGFPIWGMTAPSVIRSFLSQHDLSGKTLVPFITHGGYRLGNSLAVVAEHAPGARPIDGFSKECDQERETLREVTQWLGSVEIGR